MIVRFVIQGRTYTVSNVYYPDGDSQLVWVKWHTPSEPCVITIAVSVSGGGTAQSTITCNVVDLDGNDPPNRWRMTATTVSVWPLFQRKNR